MSAPGTITTVRIGGQPLPTCVAERLAAEAGEAWDDVLLVLPTMETGRRIVDDLVRRREGRIVFPPRFATALSLVPFGWGERVASPVQAGLAWREVLRRAKDCLRTFGEDSDPATRAALAPSFVDLLRDLAAADLTVESAAEILAPRDPRWSEWVTLWHQYAALLRRGALECPAAAQRAAAAAFEKPDGIARVIVAGVPDLPPLAEKALRRVGAEVWVMSGELDASAAFDDMGRARPAFWKNHPLAFETSQIEVFATLEDLALAAAKTALYNDRAAIICGDPGLAAELESALVGEGGAGFLPEGHALARHPVIRLASQLCRLSPASEWDAVESLLRHPDFLDWLTRENVAVDFARWNSFGAAALRPVLGEMEARFAWLPDLEQRAFDGIPSVVRSVIRLASQMGEANPVPALRMILAEIYGPRDMARRPGDKDAAKSVVETLDELRACRELGSVSGSELAEILESLGGTWTPEKPPAAVEIEGWLEVVGEDAPVLLLAGLNEGLLPSKRRVDPLLPDAARGLLGLDDATSREARDTAILHQALVTRGPRLHILSAQRASDGSPLKPSRFLLRVGDAALPARVEWLCREADEMTFSPVGGFSSSPLRLPRPASPARGISVTAFASYLACPLRYHLAERLGMNALQSVDHQLSAGAFGSWIHATLDAFGRNEDLRDSSDEKAIRDFLLAHWDARFDVFGSEVDLLLQREAGRMRLEAFAVQQAAARREGWRIVCTEWRLPGENGLAIPGWPLRLFGRIDRLEVRGDETRIVDYKTGSLSGTKNQVRSHHIKKLRPVPLVPDFACLGEERWTNLQLPLYAAAVRAAPPEQVSPERLTLAYFLLPDDPDKTGLVTWEPSELELKSAADCARGVMEEIAADAVSDWIAARDFQRFAVDIDYDDFAPLALSEFIEAGALEVLT